jgi:hypothetical protein
MFFAIPSVPAEPRISVRNLSEDMSSAANPESAHENVRTPQKPHGEDDSVHDRLRELQRNFGVRCHRYPLPTLSDRCVPAQSTWDSPTDPSDPYNWPSFRKVSIGLVFSFGQLVTLMSASMIAAALGDIERDLGIDATTAQIIFSTYFLGLAVGPFLIAPWSEMSGRKQVWLFSNAWYILWNALCPVGRSKGFMIAGRLMTGVGASAGITVCLPLWSPFLASLLVS